MNRHYHACALTLLFAACGDPLVDPQTVIGLRILGSKLTTTEDPKVAQVAPGESASLNWLVVAEQERDYSAMTLFCTAEPSRFGVPRCGSKFFEQQLTGTAGAPLSFGFELPEELPDGQEWVSLLALCEGGKPRFDKSTQRFSCSDGDQPVTGFYHAVQHAGTNHNPDLSDDTLRFGDDVWPQANTPECDAEGVPRLQRDQVVNVRLSVKGADSEKLDDASYAAASREALTYTHVATTPGLARAFSAIDNEAKSKTFELELSGDEAWSQTKQNRVGTFYLVVSDGRGGSDWLERHYCLRK